MSCFPISHALFAFPLLFVHPAFLPPFLPYPLLINTTKPQKLTPLLLLFSLSLSLSLSLSVSLSLPSPSPFPSRASPTKPPHLSAVSGMTTGGGGEGEKRESGRGRADKRGGREKRGGGLFLKQCFKTDDQLVVGYSIVPAFG